MWLTEWLTTAVDLRPGMRVLDLTRVIAGPVCTRFLAAYGADVLRVDPPGFEEVPALLPEMTAGKRTATLDLASDTRNPYQLASGADTPLALQESAPWRTQTG